MDLAPFPRTADGCRGFIGPCPSTPLDANGYVWAQRIQPPTLEVESNAMTLAIDDPLTPDAEPPEATAETPLAVAGRDRRAERD